LMYCKNWPYTFLPVGNKNAWNHWTIDACIESCVGIRKHRGNVWEGLTTKNITQPSKVIWSFKFILWCS
jgi:hypothetical protein